MGRRGVLPPCGRRGRSRGRRPRPPRAPDGAGTPPGAVGPRARPRALGHRGWRGRDHRRRPPVASPAPRPAGPLLVGHAAGSGVPEASCRSSRGCPRRTGEVEGACGHRVHDRLAPPGRRWTTDGAPRRLALRRGGAMGHGEADWTWPTSTSGAGRARPPQTPEPVEAQALARAAKHTAIHGFWSHSYHSRTGGLLPSDHGLSSRSPHRHGIKYPSQGWESHLVDDVQDSTVMEPMPEGPSAAIKLS